ncbi:polyhydroxyalkanoic acid system family protein [uncultured Methylobacterium sp.]|uniref:polyhydroxyalkanoic acid system family protein n=1 Tax=uncultured Methylobacterium sp. TaxID=157278 RepID=UPI0035CB0B10
MSKHLTIAIPHDLGADEVCRRLDMQTDWAKRRLEQGNIQVAISDWSQNERRFTARALGQDVQGGVTVAEDSVSLEATLPWMIGPFSSAIEAAAKHYAARLLAPVAPD